MESKAGVAEVVVVAAGTLNTHLALAVSWRSWGEGGQALHSKLEDLHLPEEER